MSIKISCAKGRDPTEVYKEFRTTYGTYFDRNKDGKSKESYKDYQKKKEEFEKEALKSNSYGEVELHKNNWRALFKEYPWVTIGFERKSQGTHIMCISDYPIGYRCGRSCMTIMTREILDFYDKVLELFKKEELIQESNDKILWNDEMLEYIKNIMDLVPWEASVLFKMIDDLNKIEEN